MGGLLDAAASQLGAIEHISTSLDVKSFLDRDICLNVKHFAV